MNTHRSPSDPAVRRFIARSMIVRIATLSPAGNADIIPLFFVSYRGRLYMGTRSGNLVVRDLMANPEVALLFHGERLRHHDRVLQVRGRAAWVTEGLPIWRIYFAFGLRYHLSPGGFWNNLRHWRLWSTRRKYGRERAGERGLIEVTPETARFLRT